MKYTLTTPQDLITPIRYLVKIGAKQLLLKGPLGAGKTTLVQERVRQLSDQTIIVQSPTYTYMNLYDEKFIHIDMRRIEDQSELYELGIVDAIDQYERSAIERPKRENQRIIPGAVRISIEKKGDKRILTIQE